MKMHWIKAVGLALLAGIISTAYSRYAHADVPVSIQASRAADESGHTLSAKARQDIMALSAEEEKRSGNQVVAVVVNDLRGTSVEDFTHKLATSWGLGQKKADNGVMLLVALKERKIRIEVGYGLEHKLTDARSRQIIESQIKPYLKRGDFDTGMTNGVKSIIAVLKENK
jgi:uncharacterized protein